LREDREDAAEALFASAKSRTGSGRSMIRTDAIVANTFYGLRRAAAILFSALWPQQISAGRTASRPDGGRPSPGRIRTIPRRLAPVLAAGWLAACSAALEAPDQPGAAPPPDLRAGQARLYFYRPSESLFPAIQPEVIINGRKVGVSVVGEAFYRDARPGRYEIFLTSDDDDRLTVTLAPGEVHYVRTSIALSWLGPHLSPASVEAERGALESQGLNLVEPRLED
jgi:hypothetical protein